MTSLNPSTRGRADRRSFKTPSKDVSRRSSLAAIEAMKEVAFQTLRGARRIIPHQLQADAPTRDDCDGAGV